MAPMKNNTEQLKIIIKNFFKKLGKFIIHFYFICGLFSEKKSPLLISIF